MRRGQIALEYVFTIGFAMLIVVGYLIVADIYHERTATQARQESLESIAFSVQQELLVATQVQNGYRREVYIPPTHDSRPVQVNDSEGIITISQQNEIATVLVPQHVGTVTTGVNIVQRINGEVVVS